MIPKFRPQRALALGVFLALIAGCRSQAPRTDTAPPPSISRSEERPRNFLAPHRALWIDAYENASELARPGAIAKLLRQSKRAHIDAFILGVKDVSGLVIYPSRVAPHFSEWHRVFQGTPEDRAFPPGFDLLKHFLDAAHPAGFPVYAGVPVFMEGTQLRHRKIGPVWAHPDWEQVAFVNGHLVPLSRFRPFLFVNPNHPDVQKREMAILREVARYPVDGIVLDYCRYYGPNADFSPLSRRVFFPYSDMAVKRWPQDVLPGGSRYDEWMRWRELTIKWFVGRARQECQRIHPGLIWTAYYGGYATSPSATGTNWLSRDDFGNRNVDTSLLEFYDFLCLGFYVPQVTPNENGKPGPSIQAMAERAEEGVQYQLPILGSLYLKQFAGRPGALKKALAVLQERNAGTMLFDLSWIRRLHLWPALEAVQPHPRLFPGAGKGD